MKFLMFDLDGTLIDSKKDIALNVNRAFREKRMPELPEAEIGNHIGQGLIHLFTQLLPKDTLPATVNELSEIFQSFYSRHLLDHTKVYPGVREVLTHFKDYPKVVITNKNQKLAETLLDSLNLKNSFLKIYGAEAFATKKPDKAPLLGACAEWNQSPQNSVMIGDSLHDFQAGRSAGASTALVLYGYADPVQLKNAGADIYLSSLSELIGKF